MTSAAMSPAATSASLTVRHGHEPKEHSQGRGSERHGLQQGYKANCGMVSKRRTSKA
jgi:hypothetical protein